MFSFEAFVLWLRTWANQISGREAAIEVLESSSTIPSVLFRLSGKSVEAELVVWANGRSSAMVFDLTNDQYVVDRHDAILTGAFEVELYHFCAEVEHRVEA